MVRTQQGDGLQLQRTVCHPAEVNGSRDSRKIGSQSAEYETIPVSESMEGFENC